MGRAITLFIARQVEQDMDGAKTSQGAGKRTSLWFHSQIGRSF